jgi:PcfJ-like protein
MDAKPKSNKLKRLATKERLARKAERRAQVHPRAAAAAEVALAERVLKESKAHGRDQELVLRGAPVRVPLTSDLHVIARLFAGLGAPRKGEEHPLPVDTAALRELVGVCRERTDLFDGPDATRYANALLALSAHTDRWLRMPGDWAPRSHNAYRQFHALVRHLTARYDVPAFMDTAWLEGLTAKGVTYQGWYLHVAQGQNLRTAEDLPMPLTKRQAHLYLQAPADFDVLAAFRWAQVLNLGGDERLVRSLLATRAGTDYAHDDFWLTVVRWLVAQPMLDPSHHGPIVDWLYHQRYEPSVPNPEAHRPGAPLLVAAQPNLSMKGRNPEALLRAVLVWHRRLGRERAAAGTTWDASAIRPFEFAEGQADSRRVFTITELLSAGELNVEGRAMGHCVGSYTRSCASRRVSIWSLRVVDAYGVATRLLTLEVTNHDRQIVQARRKFNAAPMPKEMQLLRRWADAGGPTLSKWLAT